MWAAPQLVGCMRLLGVADSLVSNISALPSGLLRPSAAIGETNREAFAMHVDMH